MKKLEHFMLWILLFFATSISAQMINLNPDPNDEPWIAGDAAPTPPDIEATIPSMTLSAASAATPLPNQVNNSEYVFMPPVFHQGASMACVQVAEVWYTFGYEINRLRNVSGGDQIGDVFKHNQYHPFYTYNFLNQGTGSTLTSFNTAFKILAENGCPSYDLYDDPALYGPSKYKYWMQGYENYSSGLNNKVDGSVNIEWGASYASIELMKHWLSDHNEGSEYGGLAIIGVYLGGALYGELPPTSPEAGKMYISHWGTDGAHALTIVGYNDDVLCKDINGDNLYTNDDFDGNGIIELDECEKGAFLAVNSYGEGWGDGGFIYIPYYLMREGLQTDNQAHTCYVSDDSEPILNIKTSIEYPCRNKLRYYVGFAENALQTYPVDKDDYLTFIQQGGCNEMRGAYSGPLESSLNFDYLYGEEDFGKIFFIIKELEYYSAYDGSIQSFSIVDYRWDEVFELECEQTTVSNVAINDDDETVLSIDYHLLPFEITSGMIVNSNRVSRFSPTVSNNSTLTIQDGVEIDMYNSNIIVEEGSTLIIGDNVKFNGKRGYNTIVVRGNLQIGNNVEFNAVDEVRLKNRNQHNVLSYVTFNDDSKLVNETYALTLQNCSFNDANMVSTFDCDVTVTNSIFNNTWLYIIRGAYGTATTASIQGCTFAGEENENPAILVNDYDEFSIESNTISGFRQGLNLRYSGNGVTGNQNVSANTIFDNTVGIELYNSIASVAANIIFNNNIGLKLANRSNVALYGDPFEIQYIYDNDSYEVYAAEESFPWYFRYNEIVDEDNIGNPEDPMVYHSTMLATMHDVEYNCWGTNFNHLEDLYPINLYDYLPIYCKTKSSPYPGPDEILYNEAKAEYEAGNYAVAKVKFLSVVEQYNESKFAQASLKDLFSLEQHGDNDFASLRDYYRTNDSIIADTALSKLADFMANRCDVKLENWQVAIDWYTSIIQNPESFEDSIFAVVDLNYLSLQIDTTAFKGTVMLSSEYKPGSKEEFDSRYRYLLSLIPGELSDKAPNENSNTEEKDVQLYNMPNPFTDETQIVFSLDAAANVQIIIYDNLGRRLKNIDPGYLPSGIHKVDFIKGDLQSGIYLYSLKVNGIIAETKKMTIY